MLESLHGTMMYVIVYMLASVIQGSAEQLLESMRCINAFHAICTEEHLLFVDRYCKFLILIELWFCFHLGTQVEHAQQCVASQLEQSKKIRMGFV